MAVEANGMLIRVPQGDTGHVKFVTEKGEAMTGDVALFTVASRSGGAILRKVLALDEKEMAFNLPFVYDDTATLKPDNYEWSLRVVHDGKLDDKGRIVSAQGSHTPVLKGKLTVLPVAGGAR